MTRLPFGSSGEHHEQRIGRAHYRRDHNGEPDLKKRVVIAARLGQSLIEALENDPRFDLLVQPVEEEERLVALVREADVLVTRYFNRVTRRVLEAGTALQLVAQGTSGIDNIDLEAAGERGIRIVSLPGENANAVAELVLGYMISLTRTVPFYDRSVRSGEWLRDDCQSRHELRHYRLGLVGLGRVGSRVAHLASLFGMDVVAFDPYIAPEEFGRRGAAAAASLGDLLGRSDIVSLHVPITTETAGMIDAAAIERMPRGSFLINAARGGVVDTAAVTAALESRHLAGVAFDVFPAEPPGEVMLPPERSIVTPHIAGCSAESKASIGLALYREICAFYGMEPAGES
jgi:D-3-phosphoglycerate dehydrogenase / 2-oxoglutarate reductase